MSYTQEQLAKMSDSEIELRVSHIMGLAWRGQLKYCTDWSVTGPLMVEYGISLSFSSAGPSHAYSSRGRRYDSYNKNPLRAVCEVILMMKKA